jgi:hypothetical protein
MQTTEESIIYYSKQKTRRGMRVAGGFIVYRTGIISGAPTQTMPTTTFTITAFNTKGFSTTTVTMAVNN